jgi:hypothetical protein
MEQKKRDEAVQETKGIKRRSRSEPCRPTHIHTHHGPHLFAVFNAADGTIDKKAKKPKAQAAPIRSHQPLPTRSQYPAARSSRPVRRPATAHDAEKVNAASDASPAKASAGIFEKEFKKTSFQLPIREIKETNLELSGSFLVRGSRVLVHGYPAAGP